MVPARASADRLFPCDLGAVVVSGNGSAMRNFSRLEKNFPSAIAG